MAFSFEFAEAEQVLRLTFTGELTDSILLDAASKARVVALSLPPCKSIVDLSCVTSYQVSTPVVMRFAESPPVRPDQPSPVIVAPKDVSFGMSRMFEMLSHGVRPNMHVVHTMNEAYKWLGVESPDFHTIGAPGENGPRNS